MCRAHVLINSVHISIFCYSVKESAGLQDGYGNKLILTSKVEKKLQDAIGILLTLLMTCKNGEFKEQCNVAKTEIKMAQHYLI